jgi:hypothetical protein
MITKIYKEKYTLHYLRVAKLIVADNKLNVGYISVCKFRKYFYK